MSPTRENFFSKSLTVMPFRLKRNLVLITAGILFTSILETGTMGIIAVFVSAISDPDIVMRSPKLASVLQQIPGELFNSPKNTLLTLAGAASALLLLKNLCSAGVTYAYSRLACKLDTHFGDLLMKNYLCHDYEWHVGHHSADLVTAGTWRRFMSVVWYMGMLAVNDIMLVVMLGLALLYAAPLVTLVAIVTFGLLAGSIFLLLRPRVDKEARTAASSEQRVNKQTSDITQGIKDILISSKQNYFFEQYQKDVTRAANAQARILLLTRIPSWAFETVGFMLLCLAVAGTLAMNENVSSSVISGKLAMLGVVAWRAIPAFNRIVNSLTTLRDNLPKADAVLDAILAMPDSTFSAEEATPLPLKKGITIAGLDFRYGTADSNALHSVNVSIEAGTTVGLVGRSGSGKSTLADLVIGLLSPTAGSISIDGQPLTPQLRNNWIASVGYVGQTPFFTDGSILENVTFGVPADRIDKGHLLHCCKMAALDSLIEQLPGGMEQPLGERAGKLSGGQRQRVAIARALYRNPQLLILDEATSALDQQSENTIKNTVKNLAGSLTMLIIAHRLSTVEQCDKVVWLEGGRIVMDGTPAEVLPHYRASLGAENDLPDSSGDR
ncbi:ABC transporter ATP-binding protein [Desulfovibrio psychrotolerans]|uniref:ABC transporter ATP-binding protein n=2 Tax=Desulfovibrio psychrotolerans TaxID=415242 RepID=A0A7J0BY44_9BACT|nr:ABC transporter ATP-binding protein [Desulfovibrio psychrotolerans]